ncbi:signal transducer CD24 isoform X1 [Cavia porcellus]|uniref:signal transducer CD24 isoform X1 n=1 Tax=Cavia porcellus TaxID=10141 RepID=UPI002FE0B505
MPKQRGRAIASGIILQNRRGGGGRRGPHFPLPRARLLLSHAAPSRTPQVTQREGSVPTRGAGVGSRGSRGEPVRTRPGVRGAEASVATASGRCAPGSSRLRPPRSHRSPDDRPRGAVHALSRSARLCPGPRHGLSLFTSSVPRADLAPSRAPSVALRPGVCGALDGTGGCAPVGMGKEQGAGAGRAGEPEQPGGLPPPRADFAPRPPFPPARLGCSAPGPRPPRFQAHLGAQPGCGRCRAFPQPAA